MRKFEFQTGEYYHIYNRGVDKREVFLDKWNYVRFLRSLREFNNNSIYEQRIYIKNKRKELSSEASELSSYIEKLPKFVEIICYCLNPNHYHLLLKQLADEGIKMFMHKLGTGYTNYFNSKYNRSGSLFENRYKAIHIKSDSYLLWLSGYINGNAEIHKIAKAENWIWGSFKDYLEERGGTLCRKEIILSQFKDVDEYRDLVDVIIKESSRGKEEFPPKADQPLAEKRYFLE